jgi:hypothetical protein
MHRLSLQHHFSRDFNNSVSRENSSVVYHDHQKRMAGAEHGSTFLMTAPLPLHMPVDDLHSIDFAADKSPHFLLTLKMKGVKPISFFDSF